MTRCSSFVLAFTAFLAGVPTAAGQAPVVIELRIAARLEPANGHIEARAEMSGLAAAVGGKALGLLVNRGLSLSLESGGQEAGPARDHDRQRRLHAVVLDGGGAPLVVRYAGTMQLDAQASAAGHAAFDDGMVLLGPDAGWYPRVATTTGPMERHALDVELPPGWTAFASAVASRGVLAAPVEGSFLVAAPFVIHERRLANSMQPGATARVALLAPDEALAMRYLDAIARHLPRFEARYGAHAYPDFVVVENRAPTGLGLPGFTLLGRQVIRLPFLLDTSLPHEILHDWWGNGVRVDPREGNWSEGLTSYLADHAARELAGDGAGYRRDTLARYRSAHLARGAEPLVAFRARHDEASQALGYGRALMVFHMIRRELGDAPFTHRLAGFYARSLHRRRTTSELLAALVDEPERWFRTWWQRADAPRLALACCTLEPAGDGHRVRGRLRQTQPGPPFPLQVLLRIEGDAGRVREHRVSLEQREAEFSLSVTFRPKRLVADPDFDLMRVPDPRELPPSVAEVLGAPVRVFVVPPGLDATLAAAYRELAAALDADVRGDRPAPRPGTIIVHAHRPPEDDAHAQERFDELLAKGTSVVLVTRPPGDDPTPTVAVRIDSAASAARLARVLARYGRYGELAFAGPGTRNVHRAQGPTDRSPLAVWLAPAP